MSTLARNVWKFLISLRLTIFLLILLSGVCIVGTIIPQGEPDHIYLRNYSPTTYEILKTTGVTDLYHSWWFVGLLGAFTLNLVACSLHRIPRVVRQTARTDPVLTDEQSAKLPQVKKFRLNHCSPDTISLIAQTLSRHLAKPLTVQQGGTWYFFSETGRWAPFSFFLTHVGIVIIIAGVLVGSFGFQGFMKLAEGESSSVVVEKKSLAEYPLDFAVRCDKFEVSYYEKTGTPRDYISTLTVIEDGREVVTKAIEVNDPLIYQGIYFYQSSYGIVPGGGGEAILRFTPRGASEGKEYRAAVKQRFRIEGTQDEAEIETIIPDFAMDSQGRFFSRSEEPRNPAARVVIYAPNKEPYALWTFAQFPDFHQKPDAPYTVHFIQYYPRFYTGLQVTRDPGVWIVWVGCGGLIAGICLAFFTSHRRIWLKIEPQGNSFAATLAGSSTKNRQAFAEMMNRLSAELRNERAVK